jgi:hypothetical protein
MYRYSPPSGRIRVIKIGVDAEITTRVNPAVFGQSNVTHNGKRGRLHTSSGIDEKHVEGSAAYVSY